MIKLTSVGKVMPIYVNPDHIVAMERVPSAVDDNVFTGLILHGAPPVRVMEIPDQIIDQISEERRKRLQVLS